MEEFFASLSASIETFLNLANDPFSALFYLLTSAGWISLALWAFILYETWHVVLEVWLDLRQHHFAHELKWVLLRITVPNASEQTPKAAENLFAQLAGAHASISWAETWRDGAFQPNISLELVCHEGKISYNIRCVNKSQDLIEAAVYAQYPEAEIELLTEDYAKEGLKKFPDPEWDLWGAEFINVNNPAYMLKTYPEFEDKISGEFKDPVAAYLEVLSRLGPGERAWFQILIVPTDQKAARENSEKIIMKLKGLKPPEHKPGIVSQVVMFPMEMILSIFGIGGHHAAEKKKDDWPQILKLSPIEREILEGVERKMSKISFSSKIRFIYMAKKTVFSKPRISQAFVGAIKQTNTFHMQALKPDFKKTGMSSAIWWFKDKRNNARKTRLLNEG